MQAIPRKQILKKRQSSNKMLAFFLILAFCLLLVWRFHDTNVKGMTVTRLQNNSLPQNVFALKTAVRKMTDAKKGTYSVLFEDYQDKETFAFNEEIPYTAASVNKLPVFASLYYLVNQKELDLESNINVERRDIQDYGTGVLRYQNPGRYPLRELARVLIEKSDNTAYYVLANKVIGLEKIEEIISRWGLKQTKMEENITTNKDQALLLKAIFSGQVASPTLTEEMIGFMDNSDFEDRLPALLPKDIEVFHKIGNEISILHDVGVIRLKNGRKYYLGVLTTGYADEAETINLIAKISKLVFDYEAAK